MLRFCGFDLELVVDSVLQRGGSDPVVCSATDSAGERWLIVEPKRPHPVLARNRRHEDLSWLCAPASRRTVELVESGQATATDAVLHSLTGWVEVVEVVDGHAVPDRRMTCAELATSGLLASA